MRVLLRIPIILIVTMLFQAVSVRALSLEELRKMPGITPEKFMQLFADFEFKFHEEVQEHEQFLNSKSGDCDDFSTLAADILVRNGYTPRLVAVRMKGETHVICYVEETKTYLDYNFRKERKPLIGSSGSLTDIARKVAQSFNRDWIATYEFTFRAGVKRLVDNIVPNKSAKTS